MLAKKQNKDGLIYVLKEKTFMFNNVNCTAEEAIQGLDESLKHMMANELDVKEDQVRRYQFQVWLELKEDA